MKNSILSLLLVGLCAGCASTQPPSVAQISMGIQASTTLGVSYALATDKNSKPYFQVADVLLTDTLQTGTTNLSELGSALKNITVNNVKESPTVQQAITTGINLYESLAASAVVQQLDSSTIAQYLLAFDNGIRIPLGEPSLVLSAPVVPVVVPASTNVPPVAVKSGN